MQAQLIDYEGALDRLGGDEEFLSELLNEMVEQLKSELSALNSAIQNQDFKTLHQKAHGLKGASANLDITRLFELFKALEEKAIGQNLEGAEQLMQQISASTEELEQFVTGL